MAPAIGHFCGESILGTRKADVVVPCGTVECSPPSARSSDSMASSYASTVILMFEGSTPNVRASLVLACAMVSGCSSTLGEQHHPRGRGRAGRGRSR